MEYLTPGVSLECLIVLRNHLFLRECHSIVSLKKTIFRALVNLWIQLVCSHAHYLMHVYMDIRSIQSTKISALQIFIASLHLKTRNYNLVTHAFHQITILFVNVCLVGNNSFLVKS